MNWILAIVLAITATKEYVDRQDGALEAEIATNTHAIAENRIQIATNTYAIAENRIQIATNAADIVTLKTGKQDAISDLETIRSGAALGATALQEHQSLTNYFTKGESDGRYLQSYTETDPTVPSWAKADTKPSYTLNEVAPNTENWLGVPGTTIAGKSIKVLAKTVNGVIEGGVTITGSSNNDNNVTKYRYGGVTVTRSGTNTDYLWDTTSASGIVRRSELAPFITQHQSLTNYYTKAEVDAAIAGAGGGGVTAVSVADGGTFGTGDLADGKVEMWRVTCAGSYTPSSAWHLIGYGVWPAAGSTWQCTVWRIGSAYYCNIIVVE